MINQKVDFGYTYDFFIPAVFTIIAGGFCFLLNYILAVLIILLGITMFLPKTGIEIDPLQKRLRKYYRLSSIYFGTWYKAANLVQIELSQTNESQTIMHKSGQSSIETKSYDLVLIHKYQGPTELHSFSDYNQANTVLKFIVKYCNVEYVNKIQEIRDATLERRRNKKIRK